MDMSNWRAQLQPDSRERMVNRIMDAMRIPNQVYGYEGLQELKKIAMSIEEKVFIAATSQSDYMRKICFNILTIETRSQNSMPDAKCVNPSDLVRFNLGLHLVGQISALIPLQNKEAVTLISDVRMYYYLRVVVRISPRPDKYCTYAALPELPDFQIDQVKVCVIFVCGFRTEEDESCIVFLFICNDVRD
ncbi:hypothetical protein L1887_26081 [Cichorium endivia]|nr:hypothetical protein L1887_26081 [Cichorium endivia]